MEASEAMLVEESLDILPVHRGTTGSHADSRRPWCQWDVDADAHPVHP